MFMPPPSFVAVRAACAPCGGLLLRAATAFGSTRQLLSRCFATQVAPRPPTGRPRSLGLRLVPPRRLSSRVEMAPRTGKQLLEGIRSQVGRAGCSTALPRWDLTPEEIAALADAYIEDATATYDAVAAAGSTRDGEPPSWNSVCAPMCVEDIVGSIVDSTCTFPTHVSADKLIRDASNEAEQKLRAFQVETASRHDVFQALAALEAQGLERLELGAEQKRWVSTGRGP